MKNYAQVQRRKHTESSDRLVASIQPRSWGDSNHDQPQPPSDFSHVDLFSHAPQHGAVQMKLSIGAPNDVYEQEADKVAEQVMSTPDSAQQPIQRQEGEEAGLQMKPLSATITPLVQRSGGDGDSDDEDLQMKPLDSLAIQRSGGDSDSDDEDLQMKPLDSLAIQRSTQDSAPASGGIETQLNGSKGSGSPLPTDVRDFMEPRFGTDFSQVRVHTGNEAVQMNQDLSAQAFAHGSDIYFGAGKSPANDALTAHELTHVVQQTGSQSAPKS